jgi:AsmA protein
MKMLKYALIALAGLVILVGGVLAYVAATFNPNQYKSQIVQAVKAKTQRTLKLEGDIGLSFWPSIGAKIGKASLSERASDKEFAAIEEVRAALKLMPLLSKQVVVDTVRIKGLRVNIVKTNNAGTNLDDLAGEPSAKKGVPAATDARADFAVDIGGVEFVDAAISYTDQAAGAKYLLTKLNLKTGRIAPGVPTTVDFSAHAQGDKPKVDLPVTLKTRFTLDAVKQSLALDDLVLEAKGTAAGLANLALRLTGSASVDNAKQHARVALAGKLVDSSIKAQIEIAGFAAPVIHFDVDVDQIDLDRYLPQQAAGGGQPGGDKQAAAKEAPFDLTALRSLHADGKLKIGAFKANNVRASNVRMDLKAQGGHVEINPANASFYQGSLASRIAINAAPAVPTFAVKHSMNGISIGPFLKDLASNETLEGKGNVTLDVTTQGNTVSALKRALNGSAALNLVDGAVKGIDIAGSIRNAKAKLGALRGEQAQAADKSQKTDFSELTATFSIKNGVAHNSDLSLKSPLLRVGGEGDVNIGEDAINYLVKASVVGTAKGQGGRETDELKGITVPVRVAGPLAAPHYTIDFNAMATDTAKQKVMDELQKRLGGGAPTGDAAKKDESKPGSSNRDKLRGLFGR